VTPDREHLLAEFERQAEIRRAAKASDREALDAIAALIPEAIAAGISKREISRRTGVSRVWMDEMLRRRADEDSD
jgi:hypothetical protein